MYHNIMLFILCCNDSIFVEGDGFSNDDLLDVVGDEYKPDPGRGHGGRASDPGYDTTGDDTDQSQGAQGSQVAGILSGLGVLIVGAASSYFAYYKKKLCFKIQGGADPESGGNQSGVHSEPQTLTNLLRTS
uniref:CD99 molecule n=1 Tax=Electrophorus electricus TaxID=8005 RepID=A0AAY5F3M1_ELEEL